jgi:hypothetical protein
MSEAFDPEKVFRYTAHNFSLRADGDKQAGMVALEDYLKLLALYREAVKNLTPRGPRRSAPGYDSRCPHCGGGISKKLPRVTAL